MKEMTSQNPQMFSANQMWIFAMVPVMMIMTVGSVYGYLRGREFAESREYGFLLAHLAKLVLSLVCAHIGGAIMFGIIVLIIKTRYKNIWQTMFSKINA